MCDVNKSIFTENNASLSMPSMYESKQEKYQHYRVQNDPFSCISNWTGLPINQWRMYSIQISSR